MRRLTIGRLAVYLEPRDIWIGAYVAPTAIYVCPLPMLVLKWSRAITIEPIPTARIARLFDIPPHMLD